MAEDMRKLHPLETEHCPDCGAEMGACFAYFEDGCRQMRTCPVCNGPVSEQARNTGDAIRAQRIELGLSLREAAALLGYSPAALSAIERGRVEITPETDEDIARVFNLHAGREGG